MGLRGEVVQQLHDLHLILRFRHVEGHVEVRQLAQHTLLELRDAGQDVRRVRVVVLHGQVSSVAKQC